MRSAAHTFKGLWDSDILDATTGLFIAYIIEERMSSFRDRWMAEVQIESIKQWESKKTLDSVMSDNYGGCLELFKQHNFVYESSWTSYGNPRDIHCALLCKTFFSIIQTVLLRNCCASKMNIISTCHFNFFIKQKHYRNKRIHKRG